MNKGAAIKNNIEILIINSFMVSGAVSLFFITFLILFALANYCFNLISMPLPFSSFELASSVVNLLSSSYVKEHSRFDVFFASGFIVTLITSIAAVGVSMLFGLCRVSTDTAQKFNTSLNNLNEENRIKKEAEILALSIKEIRFKNTQNKSKPKIMKI